MEEGGNIFTFEGITNNLLQNLVLKVHSPQFYWKVYANLIYMTLGQIIVRNSHTLDQNLFSQIMMEADLGLADAYINGHFSFLDKDRGLLNLILVSFILLCEP